MINSGAVQNPDNQNPATTQTRRSQSRQIIIPKLQNPVTTLFPTFIIPTLTILIRYFFFITVFIDVIFCNNLIIHRKIK
jgi:hypothetical protein